MLAAGAISNGPWWEHQVNATQTKAINCVSAFVAMEESVAGHQARNVIANRPNQENSNRKFPLVGSSPHPGVFPISSIVPLNQSSQSSVVVANPKLRETIIKGACADISFIKASIVLELGTAFVSCDFRHLDAGRETGTSRSLAVK